MNIVVKSNHGNHTGFNAKWTELDTFNSIKDAKEYLFNLAFNVSDDIVDRNGYPFDTNRKEILCKKRDNSFSYDGVRYMVISKNNYQDFDGGYLGYLPSSIIDKIENI